MGNPARHDAQQDVWLAPLLTSLGTIPVPDDLTPAILARLRTAGRPRPGWLRPLVAFAAVLLVCVAVGGVLLVVQPRTPDQPGSGLSSPTGSPVPSLVSLPASKAFAGSVAGRPLEVNDESGWLVGVADATDAHPPDSDSSVVQGPTTDQLYVQTVICALATDVRLTITEAVSGINVDASYPWPSGQPAPGCPAVSWAVLLTFDRPVVPPGSLAPPPSSGPTPSPTPSSATPPTPSPTVSPAPLPSPSDAPAFVLTLRGTRDYGPVPVHVFDLTGRVVAARESTRVETAGLYAKNNPRLVPGRSPHTLIAAWFGSACDASTDLTIGPALDQISFKNYQQPVPLPTNGFVYGCFSGAIDRFVTLTFAPAP